MPHGVADALRRHGVSAETSTEAGLLGASDLEHVAHANDRRMIIVTQDVDYLKLAAQVLPHSGIAYCSHDSHFYGHIGHLVEALLLLYAVYSPEEMVGRVEFI
jgi:hypothetical protein